MERDDRVREQRNKEKREQKAREKEEIQAKRKEKEERSYDSLFMEARPSASSHSDFHEYEDDFM
jgi:hypothetical protein